MKNPPLIFVSGPYRAPTAWERDRNIHAAREIGAMIAMAGGYPVIPHSNTSHFDGLATDELWLDGTMELLRRCHAVVLMSNWHHSSGARAEAGEAERLGLPMLDLANDSAGEIHRFVGFYFNPDSKIAVARR
jgi:hypothetical protein